MNGNSATKQPNYVNDRIPQWLSWMMPLALAILLLNVGRIHLPAEKSPASLMQDAQALIKQGDFTQALAKTNELLKIFPHNHIYLYQAAKLALQLNKPADAANYFERFLLSSPNPGEACPDITEAYRKSGDRDKMLDSAERCVRLEPTNSDFQFELALAMERAENLAAALKQYEAGINSFPSYGDFKIGHARVLLRLGRAEEAWHELSPYLEAHPGVADAELVAGLAAEQSNQTGRAREIFEQATKNHPGNLEIKDAYKRLLERAGVK